MKVAVFRAELKQILPGILVLLAPLSGAGDEAQVQAGSFGLGNRHLRVDVGPRGELSALVDETSQHNFMVSSNQGGLWQLEFLNESQAVLPAQAGSFRCRPFAGRAPALRLVWENFGLPTAPRLRVQATVTLAEREPVSRWRVEVDGLDRLRLGQVRFPRLAGLQPQTNEMLAVPIWMGQRMAQPRKMLSGPAGKGTRDEWAYPGLLSMQCLALYQPNGPGLYVACDDAAAGSKAFACFGDGNGGLGCEVIHLPQNTAAPANRWVLPYQVELSTFRGDWIAAAERYRAWATNQAWARQSRLARGLVPEWILRTGLWVWNRGRSPDVLAPAVSLQQQLDLPVNVFWHWWHGCAYDSGFPEYLPPREGAAAFRSALGAARARGVHALIYMNQRLWGMTTESWRTEGAERFAVKGKDGKVHPEVYNTFTKAPCASMCMGTKFWRDKYAGLAERAVAELGVDGIYMDQACTSLTCYDPRHDHPPGGGAYWMRGFRSLAATIRQHCPRAVLAGEGCGEPWLPHLDLMLSLQVSRERYAAPDGWEPIPLFQAVYHPFAVLYGNYSSLTMPPYDELWPAQFAPAEPLKLLDRRFAQQFCLEQARAFVWGQQLTLANFRPEQPEQRPEEIEYALRLARLRSRAAKYLLRGTFLPPPEFEAPEATLEISRLSIYAGRGGGLTETRKRSPLVLAGAWRAPDGTVAVALASIASEPVTLALKLPLRDYGFTAGAKTRWKTGAAPDVISRIARGEGLVTVTLAPRGAGTLELGN